MFRSSDRYLHLSEAYFCHSFISPLLSILLISMVGVLILFDFGECVFSKDAKINIESEDCVSILKHIITNS